LKTKFDNIVKIRKQEVDKIKRDIQKINSALKEIENKVLKLKKELFSFSLPKSGSFSQIIQSREIQNAIKNEIDNLSSQINMLNSRKKALLEELKKAEIEYEKMKYLQAQEIKKMIKRQRLKEAKEIDEIAILLENFKNG